MASELWLSVPGTFFLSFVMASFFFIHLEISHVYFATTFVQRDLELSGLAGLSRVVADDIFL